MPPYTVAIVVDRAFGRKLDALASRIHVWICDTPVNLEAAKAFLAQIKPEASWNDSGVTTFHVSPQETPEEMIITRLHTIDLHHNEYSHDPAWSRIEVYGTGSTPRLRQELAEYGVTQYQQTESGFTCSRVQNLAA